jgi:glyoxylase-like metal-dependent hydrolase (beta-lactamase superfamily II)
MAEHRTGAARRSWFDLVRGIAVAYDGRISTFRGSASLGGGITTISLPGHTRGQTGYLIENGGDRLLIWGDVAVSTAIQFRYPRAHMLFDTDGETGYKSRIKAFEMAAAERLLVAGTYLTYPTFGYVAPRDGAFEWIAEEWRHDLANTPWVPVI